ncbi:MAG TPA: hypothetical protein VD996_05470 [Chitinophagaceae bacterium]|nr:hypothetical protein [Chitinophagaceae bacterium]
MNRIILLITFLLVSFFANTQNNLLLLQKRGKTQKSYSAGHYIFIETKQGNYADGLITKIHADTIYIRHFDIQKNITAYGGVYFDTAFRYTTAVHYRDIGAFVTPHRNLADGRRRGNILLIAGGGVLALGAVNGLYRGDPPRDWYEPASYITAGMLTGLGLLSKKARKPKTLIGRKYTIKILQLDRR